MLLRDTIEFPASEAPERVAVIFGEEQISYAGLRDRVYRLANALEAVSEPGDRIALLSENRPEYFEAYVGVPTAGRILNMLNYRLNPRELVSIMNDSQPSVLLVEPQYAPQMLELRASLPSVRHIVVLGSEDRRGGDLTYAELVAQASADRPERPADPDDVAWLMYTSGTTSNPKGVVITHRSLLHAVSSWMIEVDPRHDDVVLLPFPMCHIASFVLFGYLFRGSTIVVRPRYEPTDFLETIERHQVTYVTFAPTMLAMLLAHPRASEFDVSSVRLVTYGASSIPVDVLRSAMAYFEGARFGQGFGQTELSGNVVYMDDDTHRRAVAGEPHLLKAAGRPMALANVRILDEDLCDVPVGEVGEIVVRSGQVMKGYWRNPEETEKTIVDGWLRTGDLARRDAEGNIYLVDRKKDMIVSGGENVYTREVEDVVYQLPGVAQAAVFGLPDDHWGEVVSVAVVPDEGVTIDRAALEEHCRQHIGGFKVPRRYFFLDDLPKNASGKILKNTIVRQLTTGES